MSSSGPPLAKMNGPERAMFRNVHLDPCVGLPAHTIACNCIIMMDGLVENRDKLIEHTKKKLLSTYDRLRSKANWDGTWTKLNYDTEMDFEYHITHEKVDSNYVENVGSDSKSKRNADIQSDNTCGNTKLHPSIEKRIFELDKEVFDTTKPLWRTHFISLKEDERKLVKDPSCCTSCCLLRLHHTIGDGFNMAKFADVIFHDENDESVSFAANTEKKFRLLRKESKEKISTRGFFLTRWIKSFFYSVWLAMDMVLSVFKVAYAGIRPRGSYCRFYPVKRTEDLEFGSSECVIFPPIPLEVVKGIKNLLGVTLNDVVYSCFCAAVDRYSHDGELSKTLSEGEFSYSACSNSSKNKGPTPTEAITLRALMPLALPVSTKVLAHRASTDNVLNHFTLLSVPMPMDSGKTLKAIQGAVEKNEEMTNFASTNDASNIMMVDVHSSSRGSALLGAPFYGLSSPRTIECLLKSAKDRVMAINSIMMGLKKSTLGPVALKLSNFVLQNISEKLGGKTLLDMFERHSVMFSNVPGYCEYKGNLDKKAIFPFEKTGEGYKGLTYLGVKVTGLYIYFYNAIPQIILHSYQDKIFCTLCCDPKKVPRVETIVRYFNEELYVLSKLALLKSNESSDEAGNPDPQVKYYGDDIQRLNLFLLEKPLPGAAITSPDSSPPIVANQENAADTTPFLRNRA